MLEIQLELSSLLPQLMAMLIWTTGLMAMVMTTLAFRVIIPCSSYFHQKLSRQLMKLLEEYVS